MALPLWQTSIKPWSLGTISIFRHPQSQGQEFGINFQTSTIPRSLRSISISRHPQSQGQALSSPHAVGHSISQSHSAPWNKHSLKSLAAGGRILQLKIQLGFILYTQRISRITSSIPPLGIHDCGGSKQGMAKVATVSWTSWRSWSEQNIPWKGWTAAPAQQEENETLESLQDIQGAARLLMEPLAHPHKSRLKLPPWDVLPGRERTWLGALRGKISVRIELLGKLHPKQQNHHQTWGKTGGSSLLPLAPVLQRFQILLWNPWMWIRYVCWKGKSYSFHIHAQFTFLFPFIIWGIWGKSSSPDGAQGSDSICGVLLVAGQ